MGGVLEPPTRCFIEEVRGDDPELAKPLWIEERELGRSG